ncbi:MAG: NAD-dependent deacylase [Deltaproteobacteria bacterium]|nr:NAD-dependent deacylase [Deltaproteobacteria bacterium]
MDQTKELDREKLVEAQETILQAGYVVALTGAGMSVESGIPPFRGPGGLWTKHGEPPMDGFQRFLADPKKSWEERLNPTGPMVELRKALEKSAPNPGHIALADLEKMDILKALITQNVDNLHKAAGSSNVLEIHGNYTLLRCLDCNTRYKREEISLEALPPKCPKCGGIIKSDGVAFGEPIPPDVLQRCQEESSRCDCMLVIGTSATVYPAAAFPQQIMRQGHPVIEVNLYESELTPFCKISLHGPSGEIMPKLVEIIKQKN